MDDFNIQALTESRNSYTNLLLSKLTPQICQGFESIFEDTIRICEENDEEEKYLMTFQNFLARIPKWNQTMVDEEVERIMKECNCEYLEDLLSCVHITQLKILTSIRVGQKQKELSIDIPNLHTFIHNVYIYCARVLYKNVYLYNVNVMPLEKQKYRKEIETIIKDEIINVIRSSMPVESILKAYLDETMEEEEVIVEKEDMLINNNDHENETHSQKLSNTIPKEIEREREIQAQPQTQMPTQQDIKSATPTPPNTPNLNPVNVNTTTIQPKANVEMNILSENTNTNTNRLVAMENNVLESNTSPKHKHIDKHTDTEKNEINKETSLQGGTNSQDTFIGSRNKNVSKENEHVDSEVLSDSNTEDYDYDSEDDGERLNIDTGSSVQLSDVYDITKDSKKESLLDLGEIEELP